MVENVRMIHRLLLGLAVVFLLAGAANAILEGSPWHFLVVLGALFIVLAGFGIVSLVQAAFLAPVGRLIARSGRSKPGHRDASRPAPPPQERPEGHRH